MIFYEKGNGKMCTFIEHYNEWKFLAKDQKARSVCDGAFDSSDGAVDLPQWCTEYAENSPFCDMPAKANATVFSRTTFLVSS